MVLLILLWIFLVSTLSSGELYYLTITAVNFSDLFSNLSNANPTCFRILAVPRLRQCE